MDITTIIIVVAVLGIVYTIIKKNKQNMKDLFTKQYFIGLAVGVGVGYLLFGMKRNKQSINK